MTHAHMPASSPPDPRPQLYTPNTPQPPSSRPLADPASLPLLVYLPGIDGSGLAAYRQFPTLVASFDLRCLYIPKEDRLPFEELLALVRVSHSCSGAQG